MLKWSTIALRVEETKAVSIPTIVIKVRYNALMVFDVWCEIRYNGISFFA